MLKLDQLSAVQTIVVHDNCADGLVSALLLRDVYALKQVEFKFIQYTTPEHKDLVAEPGMLFADFSPPRERAQEFAAVGALMLDHHKSAKPVAEAFGANAIFGDEEAHPGVCGSTLVFDHVWEPLRGENAGEALFTFVKGMTTLAGIRDTWQRHDPRWREACVQQQVLSFVPRERWMSLSLQQIAAAWASNYAWIGQLLQEKQERTVKKIAEKAFRFTTPKGTRVVVFEGVKQTSDTAEAIGQEADLIIGFNYEVEQGKPKIIFSTRSHTTFNCAAMCEANGGGGHTKAAGCNQAVVVADSQSSPNPYAAAKALVTQWESQQK